MRYAEIAATRTSPLATAIPATRYYGNASNSTSLQNKTAVWDANYKGVWHLANGTTLSSTDSTSSACNGTNTNANANAATRKIAGAADLSSTTTGKIALGGSACGSSGSNTNGTLDFTTFTYYAWINVNNISGYHDIYSGGAGGLPQFLASGSNIGLNNAYTSSVGASSGTISANTWTQVAVTFTNNTNYTFYINGAAAGSGGGDLNVG